MFTYFKTSILTCQSLGEIQKARKACAEVAAAVAAAAARAGLPDWLPGEKNDNRELQIPKWNTLLMLTRTKAQKRGSKASGITEWSFPKVLNTDQDQITKALFKLKK